MRQFMRRYDPKDLVNLHVNVLRGDAAALDRTKTGCWRSSRGSLHVESSTFALNVKTATLWVSERKSKAVVFKFVLAAIAICLQKSWMASESVPPTPTCHMLSTRAEPHAERGGVA